MITAHNLLNDTTVSFDDATTPLWAVCYAYCEENNLMSALFGAAQHNKFLEFAKTLPVVEGAQSIACGNWACLTGFKKNPPNPKPSDAVHIKVDMVRYPYLLLSCAAHLEASATCDTHTAVVILLRTLAKDLVVGHNITPYPGVEV